MAYHCCVCNSRHCSLAQGPGAVDNLTQSHATAYRFLFWWKAHAQSPSSTFLPRCGLSQYCMLEALPSWNPSSVWTLGGDRQGQAHMVQGKEEKYTAPQMVML